MNPGLGPQLLPLEGADEHHRLLNERTSQAIPSDNVIPRPFLPGAGLCVGEGRRVRRKNSKGLGKSHQPSSSQSLGETPVIWSQAPLSLCLECVVCTHTCVGPTGPMAVAARCVSGLCESAEHTQQVWRLFVISELGDEGGRVGVGPF